jgi:hypothetical protein
MFALVLVLVIVAIATHTPWVLLGIPVLWLLAGRRRYWRRNWRRNWAHQGWSGRGC